MKRSEFLYFAGAFAFTAGCSTLTTPIGRPAPDYRIIFYNTLGHLNDDGDWEFPLKIYAYERRNSVERLSIRMARSRYNLTPTEADRFRNRIRVLVADSESRETISFIFDNDPENEEFYLQNEDSNRIRTDLNGIARGSIKISKDRAEQLLEAQNSDKGWLSFTATSGYRGSGQVQLIEPEGLSIISDIDDTIKVTEIPAGSRIVVKNTFFKEYTDAPGMQAMYQKWREQATFHYVSGAPWQLYDSLNNFLIGEAGFPNGSFHMKTVRKNFFSLNSWRDLRALATNELITYEQKVDQISWLMETYPRRRFILIGDSGEMDPEVYAFVRENYPDQVHEIIIRDVVNSRELQPDRLKGMQIIKARTIERGITQFSS